MSNAIQMNYQNKLEINVTPSASVPTWAPLAKGFQNLAEGLNEVLYQAAYLGDKGWVSTEVTGGQYIVTLTGVRYVGDAAQDYIFSDAVMHDFGEARKTQLRISRGDNTMLMWPVTLANITLTDGEANAASAISVTIHGNGAPTVGNVVSKPAELTIVSVAGGSAGNTAIYVNPVLTAGNSYLYRTAETVSLPDGGAILSDGWAAWDGSADITATTGHKICIAEVNASNVVQKAGMATVTSAQ